MKRKIIQIDKDVVVYKDEKYYSAFPCLEKLSNKEMIVIFRRAPQRKPYSDHGDSESAAVLVRSKDGGNSWGAPELVYKKEYGVQDPSVRKLKNGTLISSFFQWNWVKEHPFNHSVVGTFVLGSSDGGKSWDKDAALVKTPGYEGAAISEPVLELSDGELLIPLYKRGASFVMRSRDKGRTWKDLAVVGNDPFGNVSFGEPTLCQAKSGKIICMMRPPSDRTLFQSESLDGGKTWSLPRQTDIWGFPANLLTLSDGRILLGYGYRRPPYGVRACISEDEGKTWNLQEEIIIRQDGLHGDLGYPSSVEVGPNRILTAYYFHTGQPVDKGTYRHYSMPPGTRYIAGSFYKV
jgi:hypothetical protein